MTGPCPVINRSKIGSKLLKVILSNVHGLVTRILFELSMTCIHFIVDSLLGIISETILVEKITEAVVLKQPLIVCRVIVETVDWWLKSIYEQSPPTIPFTEIDRSIHCIHSLLQKPMLCYVEESISGYLVIDAIEKTDASNKTFVTPGFVFFVDKCSDPANECTLVIL